MKKDLNKNIDKLLEQIKKTYGNSSDIVTRKIEIGKKRILYVYLESVSSDDKVSNFLMKDISFYVKEKKKFIISDLYDNLKNTIPNSHLNTIKDYDDLFYHLASGYTILFVDGYKEAIAMETKTELDRGVTESTSETIIRGPKDSFTENNAINLGLIRKRIKDPNLWFEEVKIGKRTKTKVTIAYINGIANDDKVKIIKKELEKINIDGILDTGYIREFLTQKQTTAFPEFKSTERPDITCGSLLEGKIIIMVENSPYVLIAPGLLIDFLHTPEDYYQRPINASFTRLLRLFAFIITIVTPGIYISLTTFNHEIIPDELLISLAVQREGVPFPTAVSIIAMVLTFELLREADIRIPNAMGSAISIVGALVLGEAAVSAGIVSPIVIIVVAITSISGLLFTDIDFINAIRLWRFVFIFFSMICGLIGFIVAVFIFIIKMCSMECIGIPYLAPISPFYKIAQKDGFIRSPRSKMTYRPKFIAKNNLKKMGDADE